MQPTSPTDSKPDLVVDYLNEARELVLEEIRLLIPADNRHSGQLYELMLDYPLREAKALRPAICIATCRALGGRLEPVLKTAAVLELYHNAFLIHDDIEDESEMRRNAPTLHRERGTAIALNVGDGTYALALDPLLENMETIGLGKALRILDTVREMVKTTAEGQALELAWIEDQEWDLRQRDYVRMVYKKSACYSFVAPVLLGGIAGEAEAHQLHLLKRFAMVLGIAFQVMDDVLNLTAREEEYGKEILGDLWEGKRTLMLLDTLRRVSPAERQRAEEILGRPRPSPDSLADRLTRRIQGLTEAGEISDLGAKELRRVLKPEDEREPKRSEDIAFLMELIERTGSLERATRFAHRRAARAHAVLDRCTDWLGPSVHTSFLRGIVDFVVERER